MSETRYCSRTPHLSRHVTSPALAGLVPLSYSLFSSSSGASFRKHPGYVLLPSGRDSWETQSSQLLQKGFSWQCLPPSPASSPCPITPAQPTPRCTLQQLPSQPTTYLTPGPGIVLPGLSSQPLCEGWLHLGWQHRHPQQLPSIPAPCQLLRQHVGAEARFLASSCAMARHHGHGAPSPPADSRTFWIFLIWSESVSNRRVFKKSVTLATRPSM